MVLILGGQDQLSQIIGGAKHTILPLFAPFSLVFPIIGGAAVQEYSIMSKNISFCSRILHL